ncbi:hypothetical protein AARAC_006952 [Aspergillus arachidicola]|uniref:Large ribosomal subunit protein mL67 n=1 Tax=Aspergillus arachidicola TaxID=656916 RepID=A0A2G7FR42_9EURO|nr:hypothetical protein AARAC_006952 [Aspergillus arachidicola]
MASQSVTKPFQKILDPTKIGTWNVVRRPPIENHSVIQGKAREQNSNAFKTHQWKEGVRLRKAINAITHGKNIFVYHNIRTNQVVYSLTRYLEKNNVLRMWVPYYSVHFNEPKVGLRAYHLLREFAMQRQLSPPREMITISERFLDQKRPKDPEGAKKFDEKYANKVGWLMEKKHRARALMDQKATSVADVSAVLSIQEEEIANGFADGKRGYLTRTARRRRREARAKEEAKAAEQAERVAKLEKTLSTAEVDYKVQESESTNGVEGNGVKILWTDIHDARLAEAWPERVRHGELDLSRDHVMPGQKRNYGVEVLADETFKEKQPEQKA